MKTAVKRLAAAALTCALAFTTALAVHADGGSVGYRDFFKDSAAGAYYVEADYTSRYKDSISNTSHTGTIIATSDGTCFYNLDTGTFSQTIANGTVYSSEYKMEFLYDFSKDTSYESYMYDANDDGVIDWSSWSGEDASSRAWDARHFTNIFCPAADTVFTYGKDAKTGCDTMEYTFDVSSVDGYAYSTSVTYYFDSSAKLCYIKATNIGTDSDIDSCTYTVRSFSNSADEATITGRLKEAKAHLMVW